jgi:hypothetical protein
MKNTKKMGFILLFLVTIIRINAYPYTFFNHTDKPIALATQFRGAKEEPLYKKLIKSKSKETFEEGSNDIPLIKASFCLHHIYYVKEPTKEQKKNKYATAPWKEIVINWVESDNYDQLIKSADIAAIKKSAPTNKNQSLCQSRHFDIIADEHGKLYIISPVTIE